MMPGSSAALGGLYPIASGRVEGWAFDPAHPAERLRVIVLLDGDIVGFARAERGRPDLADRGIGDGAHGFVCEVPIIRLDVAKLLTVLAEAPGGLVLVAERRLGTASLPVAMAARGPAVHFDVTDLMEFLRHHREVSGIQRVQCGYLANVLAAEEGEFAIRVCAQLAGQHRYIEIGRAVIEGLLEGIDNRQAMPLGAWQAYVEVARQGTGAAPSFQPGDIILTMGAHWVHDGYFHAIEAARRDHGVFYFQVFHDLIPIMAPESVGLGMIGGFNLATAAMLACADHILANSRNSRQDLLEACRQLGASCPPVSVIPLGATLDYRQEERWPAWPPENGQASPREVFGDYVLCVGTLEPRKNHIYLYNIWRRLLEQREGAVPKLVCVGRMGWHMEDFQRHLKVSASLDGHFVHLSNISDDSLKRLYRDCLFTVFPSTYEGWGLPVAESLLFGKLCVASNTTSMPEVGGDWVVYVDPYNVNDGYAAMTALFDDRPQTAAREADLRDHYQPMTWRAASQALMDIVAASHAALPTPAGLPEGGQGLPPLELDRVYRFGSIAPPDDPLQGLGAEITARKAKSLLTGPDWHGMEEWGAWSCGLSAQLGFRVAACPTGRLVAYLTLRLAHAPGDVACAVLVNGRHQGSLTLDGTLDQDIKINLPACGTNKFRIELRLARPIRPAAHSLDQRLLGVGVRSLCVCAADNRQSRLSFFESHLQRLEITIL